jgi:uncharacterized protein YjbI with pentapeptide repeats
MGGTRRTWQESWELLRSRGFSLPRKGGPTPDEVDRPERGQKKCRGLCFRNAEVRETDFNDLSLPRTMFLRCRFAAVSFRNTNLILSCLADCGWLDCDFSGADLACADLRGAELFGCRFTGARLVGADLREAKLTGCDFTDADLTGATFDRAVKETVPLSALQRDRMVSWLEETDEGPDDD